MKEKLTTIGAAGVAAAGVAGALVVGAAPASAAVVSQPTAPVTVNSSVGGQVQRLSNKNAAEHGVRVAGPGTLSSQPKMTYSVTITRMPTTARAANQVYVQGNSQGFADGNWVNAWIKGPDGTARDAGGNWVKAGKFSLPVTFPTAGQYTVQLSLGAYPNEQWSQTVNVSVRPKLYETKPVVVETGYNGNRYLQVSGYTSQQPGSTVYVYVTAPRKVVPVLVGTATVGSDGTYIMTSTARAAQLSKDGLYWVNVARARSPLATIGITTYYNTAY